jgi:hypothetical protein
MAKVLNILDWLRKIPGGFLLALSIVLGLLVFLPDSIADALAVKEFRTTYRTFLGPALLLTTSFALTKLIMAVWHLWQAHRSVRHRTRQLHELTAEEKGYLARFIIDGVNTIHVAFGDGVAGGLEAKGVIYVSSNTLNILEGVAYNLQPWARKELSENTNLLSGAVGRPMTNKERVFGRRR